MASDKRATLIAIKKDSQRPNVRDTVNIWFKEFTGCALKDISSCESIVQLLHSPRDGSSLAVARIFFGEPQVMLGGYYSITASSIK